MQIDRGEPGTVTLIRTYDHPVPAVFTAWADQDAVAAWSDPGDGWHLAFDRFDFRVGHVDLCRFGPEGGPEFFNENRYLAIDPGRRIVFSTSLTVAGRLTFAGVVTVEFAVCAGGCEMRLVEHGIYFDAKDDAASHREGWSHMLDGLGRYLDSRIPPDPER